MDLAFYFEKINASPVDVLLELFGTLTDLHIGSIKIGEINWKHSFGEIGILIAERDFQQRGYATGALQQTIGLAFEELKSYKLLLDFTSKMNAQFACLKSMVFVWKVPEEDNL